MQHTWCQNGSVGYTVCIKRDAAAAHPAALLIWLCTFCSLAGLFKLHISNVNTFRVCLSFESTVFFYFFASNEFLLVFVQLKTKLNVGRWNITNEEEREEKENLRRKERKKSYQIGCKCRFTFFIYFSPYVFFLCSCHSNRFFSFRFIRFFFPSFFRLSQKKNKFESMVKRAAAPDTHVE